MISVSNVNWNKFKEEIKIDDVEKGLLYQTELYCAYAEHYAEAVKNRIRAKWELEKTEAILKDHIRNTVRDDKGKPLSDAKINAIVIQKPEYIAVKDKLLEAEILELELKLIMDAINIRKDMLRSLAANRREELAQGAFSTNLDTENEIMLNKLQLLQNKFAASLNNSDIIIKGE